MKRDRRDRGLRPRDVGEQRGQRPVRHDDGADAAAALDRRLHRLDGGPLLRGVGHDAVLTSSRRRRCRSRARTRCASCATSNDAAVGVPHLQALGVHYVMVRTDEAKREAAEQQPGLTLLATSARGRSTRSPTPTSSCRSTCSRSSSTGARATSASATSSSARAGSRTPTSGRRSRPTTAPTSGSGSPPRRRTARPTRPPRAENRGDRIVVPEQTINPVPAAGPGQRRRDRRAGAVVRRRPGRRPGAGQGLLLPELGGEGAEGPYRAVPT